VLDYSFPKSNELVLNSQKHLLNSIIEVIYSQKHVTVDPKSSVYAIEQFYSIMAGGSLGPYDRKPGLSCSHFGERSNTLYLSAYMDVLLMTEYRTVAAEAYALIFSPISASAFEYFYPKRVIQAISTTAQHQRPTTYFKPPETPD
jgi:hypothetical protein